MRELNAWAEISLRNLSINAQKIINIVGEDVALMAVVKANAYGHGLTKSALTLWAAGAQWLCTNDIEEALEIRRVGIKSPILILGYVPAGLLGDAVRDDLSLSLFDMQTARLLNIECGKQRKSAYIHIKVDTGMHRLGVSAEELPKILLNLQDLPAVKVQGIYSHFANISNTEYSDLQLKRFQYSLVELQRHSFDIPMVHMANSRALLRYPMARFDAVRPGGAMYGLVPDFPAEPVMALKARVAMVKKINHGETVGYKQLWKASKNSLIAVVTIGYADGIPLSLTNKSEVLIAGKRCPIIGRVCMNMLMADVTGVPVVPKPGEEVVIIGNQGNETISVSDIAKAADTTEYEIAARISPALPRVYLE